MKGEVFPATRRAHGSGTAATLLLGLLAVPGCAPILDVRGVYFPGWLVSSVAGVAGGYLLVYWLGRRADARPLAESGLFFVSVTAGIALSVWWLAFSGF